MPGWTRISEYKHSPNQPASASKLPGTIIYREYRYLQNTSIIQKFVMFVSFAINMLSLALMTVIHTIQYQIQETKNFMPSIRYKVPYRALGNDVKYKAVGVKVLEKFIFTTPEFLKLAKNCQEIIAKGKNPIPEEKTTKAANSQENHFRR